MTKVTSILKNWNDMKIILEFLKPETKYIIEILSEHQYTIKQIHEKLIQKGINIKISTLKHTLYLLSKLGIIEEIKFIKSKTNLQIVNYYKLSNKAIEKILKTKEKVIKEINEKIGEIIEKIEKQKEVKVSTSTIS